VTETGISIGDRAPDFRLRDTVGAEHDLEPGGSTATVVYWTCNHCPYALAWQVRIHAVVRDYAGRNVRFLAVNSNDAERYPADSPEAMRERVEREGWQHPFLHDPSQEVAADFGARKTPDVFVLDEGYRLRYRGAPDGDYEDPGANAEWLRAALDAVLDGRDADPDETEPVGCSVKWKA